jgi:hypothetical protein
MASVELYIHGHWSLAEVPSFRCPVRKDFEFILMGKIYKVSCNTLPQCYIGKLHTSCAGAWEHAYIPMLKRLPKQDQRDLMCFT